MSARQILLIGLVPMCLLEEPRQKHSLSEGFSWSCKDANPHALFELCLKGMP